MSKNPVKKRAMEFQYLPDINILEEKQDFLNFKEAAQRILSAIKNSRPPYTWGIYGDWGSGKTSLMRLIMKRMEDELEKPDTRLPSILGLNQESDEPLPLHIPVWFDAWRYENEINIIYPLFHTIREDYFRRHPQEKRTGSFIRAFKRVAYTSLFSLTDLTLRSLAKVTLDTDYSTEDIEKNLKLVDKELETVFSKWTDLITELRGAFESFVHEYIELYRKKHSIPEGRKLYLAIFIDDLDRCLPDVAIEILERIKNHLVSDSCIFILGINRSVVYKRIRKKYGDLDIDGRQHLEKIIQHSVGVPRPSKEAIIKFGIESLKALVVSTGKDNLDAYFNAFSETLYEAGFTNPRKIKRIMNHYLSFIMSHVEIYKDIDNFDLPTVVRLIILREYYQEFYDLFREAKFEALASVSAYDGSDKSRGDFIHKYGAKWESLVPRFERMKKVVEMEPGKARQDYEYQQVIDELFGLED
jgi:hypothetical protein